MPLSVIKPLSVLTEGPLIFFLLCKYLLLAIVAKGPIVIVTNGALDRGVLMSCVDFKKWKCRMSLLLKIPDVSCRI